MKIIFVRYTFANGKTLTTDNGGKTCATPSLTQIELDYFETKWGAIIMVEQF